MLDLGLRASSPSGPHTRFQARQERWSVKGFVICDFVITSGCGFVVSRVGTDLEGQVAAAGNPAEGTLIIDTPREDSSLLAQEQRVHPAACNLQS